MANHKHHDVMIEAAKGARIEHFDKFQSTWTYNKNPSFFEHELYRVEPKPNIIRFTNIYPCSGDDVGVVENAFNEYKGANLKITYSGETGEPIKVELI